MKALVSLSKTIRRFTFMKAIAMIVTGLFTFTSCNKESDIAPEAEGVRTSGFVQNEIQTDATGFNNGYFWSLYTAGGTASITQGNAGNFAINYSGVNDVVGGKGWNPGSARTVNYNIGSQTGSYDFVGVYGWTRSPLIEYYVVERGFMPWNYGNNAAVNYMTSDGHQYRFCKHQQVNQPSIIGTATFWQYIDNWGGATTGSNRSINMANHINNWRSRGGQGFGSYDYMILAVEAFGGKSGYINATVW